MASHGSPSKPTPTAAATDMTDRISPSGSSSTTPNESRLKLAAPDAQHRLDIEDLVPRNQSFFTPGWKKIERKIPSPVLRWSRIAVAWVRGPEVPQRYRIIPLFEHVQTFPVHVLGRLPKLIAIGTYGVACLLWAVLFGVIVSEASLPGDIGGFGAPVKLSCVAQLWYVGMQ